MFRTILTVALVLVASEAWSWGWEGFGNHSLSDDSNYTEWPNVMPVVNDPHRVYHSWVNGNEHFYFAGDTAALNAALKNFAAIKGEKLTVVLHPGPGEGASFNEREFKFNWKLHLLGGIAEFTSRQDRATNIWDPTPYLHVYVDDSIELDEVEIPDGVELLEIAVLKTRYAKCLASSDRTVRGWCCGHIAALDLYDAKSMRQIASLLDDEDDWVKLNAAGALASFESNADEVIECLESVTTEDQQLQERIAKTIDSLRMAKPDESKHQAFQESLASIHAFVVDRREAKERDNASRP